MNEFSEFVKVFEGGHDFEHVQQSRKVDREIPRNRQVSFERLVLILAHHRPTQIRRLACLHGHRGTKRKEEQLYARLHKHPLRIWRRSILMLLPSLPLPFRSSNTSSYTTHLNETYTCDMFFPRYFGLMSVCSSEKLGYRFS